MHTSFPKTTWGKPQRQAPLPAGRRPIRHGGTGDLTVSPVLTMTDRCALPTVKAALRQMRADEKAYLLLPPGAAINRM